MQATPKTTEATDAQFNAIVAYLETLAKHEAAEVEIIGENVVLSVEWADGETLAGKLSVSAYRTGLELRVTVYGETLKTADDVLAFTNALNLLHGAARYVEAVIG